MRARLLAVTLLAISCAPPQAREQRGDSWQIAVSERIRNGRTAFHESGLGAFTAVNREQGFLALADAEGLLIHGGDLDGASRIRMRVAAWGRDDRRSASAAARARWGVCPEPERTDPMGRCIRRVELRHEPAEPGAGATGLTEWYRNTERGLEQGFDLGARPAGSGALRIEIRLDGARAAAADNRRTAAAEGNAAAEETAAEDELALVLRDAAGGELLGISAPVAVDRRGRSLPARLLPTASGFAYEVDDRGADYPLTIDPWINPLAAWTDNIDNPQDALGFSVAGAGDVNGDGFDDVLVGVPGWDGGQISEGAAFLYLGSAVGLGFGASWSAESDQPYAFFGSAVAGAGDVDDDGFGDILVGADQYDAAGPVANAGAVFLYRGNTDNADDLPFWSFEAAEAEAWFGRSAAGIGDIDGDGFDDLAVGAPGADGSGTDHGTVSIFLGGAAGPAAAPDLVLDEAGNDAAFGHALHGAGDADGDGLPDLVVGAPGWTQGINDEGGVFLFRATGDAALLATHYAIASGIAGSRLGWSVSAAGDVNGDGFDDILAGAPSDTTAGSDAGAAHVWPGGDPGPAPAPLWSVTGPFPGARLGWAVSDAGDPDGDGFDDVAVGVPAVALSAAREGAVSIYPGSAAGPPPAPGIFVAGGGSLFNLGISLDAAGRVDGDSHDDLVVGALLTSADDETRGAAMLLRGAPADVDLDGDGYCAGGAGCAGGISGGDCDDANAAVHPGAEELCDGADNDCDGAPLPEEADGDGDGVRICEDDCDDGNATIHPGALELCDPIDHDCDGAIDNGLLGIAYWPDLDGDGYGNRSGTMQRTCEGPPANHAVNGIDCDDSNPAINPGAEEIPCNSLDDDCDELSFDSVDSDGDGFDSCVDCNDTNRQIHPDMGETCGDEIDQNCDGFDLVCPPPPDDCITEPELCTVSYDCSTQGDGGARSAWLLLLLGLLGLRQARVPRTSGSQRGNRCARFIAWNVPGIGMRRARVPRTSGSQRGNCCARFIVHDAATIERPHSTGSGGLVAGKRFSYLVLGSWLLATGCWLLVLENGAQAQNANIDTQLFNPTQNPRGFLSDPAARPGEARTVSAGLHLVYESSPLVLLVNQDETARVIANRFGVHLGGWFAPVPRFGLGVRFPLYGQSGDATGLAVPGFAAGDLNVDLLVNLFDKDLWALGVGADFFFPTATRHALAGESRPRFAPRLAFEIGSGRIGGMLSLGWMFRSGVVTGFDLDMGMELRLKAGVRVEAVSETLWVYGELDHRAGLTRFWKAGAENPVELRVGLRALPIWGLKIDAGFGGGLGGGYGTPGIRVWAGASFFTDATRKKPEKPPEQQVIVEAKDPVPPDPVEITELQDIPDEPDEPDEPEPEDEPVAELVDDRIVINREILFALDSDELLEESYPILDAVMELLDSSPEVAHVLIEGHASTEGSVDYNWDLSTRRAQAVFRYLVESGVNPKRLSYRGMGEVIPGAGNEANRRVEFHVVEQLNWMTDEIPNWDADDTPVPWTGRPPGAEEVPE